MTTLACCLLAYHRSFLTVVAVNCVVVIFVGPAPRADFFRSKRDDHGSLPFVSLPTTFSNSGRPPRSTILRNNVCPHCSKVTFCVSFAGLRQCSVMINVITSLCCSYACYAVDFQENVLLSQDNYAVLVSLFIFV